MGKSGGGGGGGGTKKYTNQRYSHNTNQRKYNPPRGGPGMLLSSETGKERKCMREGLEILRHYHHLVQANTTTTGTTAMAEALRQPIDSTITGSTVATNTLSTTTNTTLSSSSKGLSLEEEIAMLNRGASTDEVLQHLDSDKPTTVTTTTRKRGGGPFQVYDTGCRGTVFLMCTLPGCSIDVTAMEEEEDAEGKDSKDSTTGTKSIDSPPPCDSTEPTNNTNPKKRPTDDSTTTTTTTTTMVKKQKVQSSESTQPQQTPIQTLPPPAWDPIQTVQTIITDIQTPPKPTTTDVQTTITHQPPSSRFVTRMIPIQITCYASMKEMRNTVRALLESKFIPLGLERMGGGTRPTFKIDFRKRNCSNVKRAEIIDMVAGLVSELTKEALGLKVGDTDADADGKDAGKDATQLFTVDLKHAEYTILIEVCQTLCGMSVIPNADAFRNFNLIVMREKAEEE